MSKKVDTILKALTQGDGSILIKCKRCSSDIEIDFKKYINCNNTKIVCPYCNCELTIELDLNSVISINEELNEHGIFIEND